MSSLKAIIRKLDELPPMPEVGIKISKLTADPDTDIEEVLQLIDKDQSLTAKLLRLCNSPFYGLSNRVESVRQAVVLLGFKTLSSIVVTSCSSFYFKNDANGYGVSSMDLWRHSVATAIACQIIAKKFAPEKVGMIYTAGLLHDIGKVVLNDFVGDELPKILELVDGGKSFIEAETEVLGMHHGMIAGKLARKWKFPEELVEALKYHHEPQYAVYDKELCELVHLGNIITNTLGVGTGIDSFANTIDEELQKKYPLSEAEIQDIIVETQMRVEEAEQFIQESIEV